MIERVTDNIWVIVGNNAGTPFSHSLYIRDGGGFLIDAGSDRTEIARLRKGEGISTVVVSHYHFDHRTYLSDLPGCEVWATDEDGPGLASVDTYLSWIGALGTEWEDSVRDVLTEFQPTRTARVLSDGEELRFGKTRAIVVTSPGHTAGHLCLHFPDDGILFLGDYDLSSFGPTYGDTRVDIDMFYRSARRLAEIGTETNVVSHGQPIHRGCIDGKMEAYLSVIDRREEALRRYLVEPRSRENIIALGLIYGSRRSPGWMDQAEWAIVSKNLNRMMARGEVALIDGAYTLMR